MKRAFSALIVAILCAFAAVFSACSEPRGARYIQLDKDSLTLACGQSYALVAEVTSAEVVEVIWSSSDDSVAGVDGGIVTAYAEGKATIYASADGKVASCEVTVGEFVPEDDDDEDVPEEEIPDDGQQSDDENDEQESPVGGTDEKPPVGGNDGQTAEPGGEDDQTSPPDDATGEDTTPPDDTTGEETLPPDDTTEDTTPSDDDTPGEDMTPPDGGDDQEGDIPESQRGRAEHFVCFDYYYEGGTQLYCRNADGSAAAHSSGIALTCEVATRTAGAQFGDRVFERAAEVNAQSGINVECFGRTEITLYVNSNSGTAISLVAPNGERAYEFVQAGQQKITFVAAYAGVFCIDFGGDCLLYAISAVGAAEGKEDVLPDESEELFALEVETDGAKLEYAFGEEFSADGIKVYGQYVCRALSRVTRRPVTSGISFSGYDRSASGEQTITVSCGGVECTYTVTVGQRQSLKISFANGAGLGGYIADGVFCLPCGVDSPTAVSPRILTVSSPSGEVISWRMLLISGSTSAEISDELPLQLDVGNRITVTIEAEVRLEDGSIAVESAEVTFAGVAAYAAMAHT